jgi:hypothetical protein
MSYVGIDPGKDGAIVCITGKRVRTYKFPKIGLDIDERALWKIFTQLPDDSFCVLELVHSIHNSGAKSNFEFGGTYFMLRMALAARGLAFRAVTPKEWQKRMFHGRTLIKSPKGGRDTKAMALSLMTEMYPAVDLKNPDKPRAYTPDSGIVDALAMATYARETFQF